MKIKTTFFTLGLLLVLFASKAQAQSGVVAVSTTPPSITKNYEFVADRQPFSYSQAPRTLIENGTNYLFRSIEYEILDETPVMKETTQAFTREISRTGLSKQNDNLFPHSLSIRENGFSGELSRTAVRYQPRTEKVDPTPYSKQVSFPYSLAEPMPKTSIDIAHNGKTVALPFKELKATGSKWQENVIAKVVFSSDNDQTFTLDGGKECSFDSSSPPYLGMEHEILTQLRLDAGTHKITGAIWLTGISGQDGRYTATAQYTLSRLVTRYVAVYQGEAQNPDKTWYDATAVYSGSLSKQTETGAFTYKVKAIATYDAEIKPTPSPTPTPTPTPSPTPTPTPVPTPSIEPTPEPPKKKSGVLGTVIMIVVVCGAAAGGFFLWQKKQAQEE